MVHGWGGSSEDNWFPWLTARLEEKGIKVKTFDMPDTDNPKIEEWVGHLRENIPSDEIDEQTYFIGHSIGCQTILRFLEKLHRDKKTGGCIFVAPFFKLLNQSPEELLIAHPWENTPIDFGRVLSHCDNFLAFFSDDDEEVSLEESNKFKEKLGAKVIIEKNKGHFDGEVQERILEETLKFL